MTAVDIAIFAGVLVSAFISKDNKRGLLWLALMTFSYLLSSTYWRSGFPHSEVVAGLCDVFICFSVYYLGRERWELWLWRLFQVSLLTNILYLANGVFSWGMVSHEAYSIVLELLNWLAIISIGTISAMMSKGFTNGRAFDPWVSVFGFVRPVYAKARIHKETR